MLTTVVGKVCRINSYGSTANAAGNNLECCSCTVLVIATGYSRNGYRRRAHIGVVAISNGIIRTRSQLLVITADLDSRVANSDSRRDCTSGIGLVCNSSNRYTGDALRLNGKVLAGSCSTIIVALTTDSYRCCTCIGVVSVGHSVIGAINQLLVLNSAISNSDSGCDRTSGIGLCCNIANRYTGNALRLNCNGLHNRARVVPCTADGYCNSTNISKVSGHIIAARIGNRIVLRGYTTTIGYGNRGFMRTAIIDQALSYAAYRCRSNVLGRNRELSGIGCLLIVAISSYTDTYNIRSCGSRHSGAICRVIGILKLILYSHSSRACASIADVCRSTVVGLAGSGNRYTTLCLAYNQCDGCFSRTLIAFRSNILLTHRIIADVDGIITRCQAVKVRCFEGDGITIYGIVTASREHSIAVTYALNGISFEIYLCGNIRSSGLGKVDALSVLSGIGVQHYFALFGFTVARLIGCGNDYLTLELGVNIKYNRITVLRTLGCCVSGVLANQLPADVLDISIGGGGGNFYTLLEEYSSRA